jgi:eukaryotic-like serine/threonine-protein kinase
MSPLLATHQSFPAAPPRAEKKTPSPPAAPAPFVGPAVCAEPLQLGPWLLESLLAEGQVSRLFRARPAATTQTNSAARYVVKVLRDSWQDDPIAVARIRQEALVGRCVAHRHVAPVLSFHIHRPPYYVVLPLLNGRPVSQRIAARGRLNIALALWIARQAAQALEAMHTAGYVHGDVNPRNLLVAKDGHVTLIDLSCTCRIRQPGEPPDSMLELTPLLGTPKYLAPERFAGHDTSAAGDLYSLGLTLLEMLAGRLPDMPIALPALATFKRQAAFPSVRTFAPQVPQQVADLIRELTARDPLRRPSADELIERLMRLEIATLEQRLPV